MQERGITGTGERDRPQWRRLAAAVDARLCVDATGRTTYLIAVDGKPANRGGPTPPQMGRFAVRVLHAEAYVNLDTGGSTTMVYRGDLVSRPSYGYARAVMYAIAVFRV